MMRCRLCGITTDNPAAARHWREDVGYCQGWWEPVPQPTHWLWILLMTVGIVGGVVALVAGAVLFDAGTTPVPTASPTATATTTPSPTHTKGLPTATNTPTSPTTEPFAPTMGLERAVARPSPVNLEAQGDDLVALPVPPNTTVNPSGCSADGHCEWYNYYWAPTHEIVLQGAEPWVREVHERCHAHQHWSINGGAPLAPADFDLESWYGTLEGQSFLAAATDWPYSYEFTTQHNGIEDFAEMCALWYTDADRLYTISPARYDWARANLP